MLRGIQRAFAECARVQRAFLKEQRSALVAAIEAIAAAFERGNKLLLFGNGGSAADAQHIAAEFVNRYSMERPPLPAISLTTDTSALTSIANDYRYEDVFAKQLEALADAGDVALAISTSGNARSVLTAAQTCRRLEVQTIALTGGSGGKLATAADIVLRVGATTETARIQETHILIGHIICEQVDERLFGSGESRLKRPARTKRPG